MSSPLLIIPSVNKNPVANSKSFPGVRIVIETFVSSRISIGPNPNRISKGSSTTMISSVVCDDSSFILVIETD